MFDVFIRLNNLYYFIFPLSSFVYLIERMNILFFSWKRVAT